MSEMTSEGFLILLTIIGFVILIGLAFGIVAVMMFNPGEVATMDPDQMSWITKVILSLRSAFVPVSSVIL